MTGYNEFDYIYKSVHEFGGQYVLKSDEEKLLDVIKKYIFQIEEEEKKRLLSEKMLRLMENYKNNRKEKLWSEYLRNPENENAEKLLEELGKEEGIDFRMAVKCAVGRLLRKGSDESVLEEKMTQYFLKVKEEYKYFYHIYSVFLLQGGFLSYSCTEKGR